MRFGILGPLSLTGKDGGSRTLSALKPKIVLANLLTRPGHVVSTQQLMDELWDGRPPRTATTALQVYVCKLRKLLSDGGAEGEDSEIVTQPPGYLFSMAGHDSDLQQFERLRDRADRLQVQGDLPGAVLELRKAVKLWHGPALADVRYTPRLRSAAERLDELRVSTIERLLELELVLGRHRGQIGELSLLAGEYPTRERVHELLMIALYNAGRPNEALEAYRTIRTAMNDEFGLEPSHQLRSLQRAILSRDTDRLSVPMESPYQSRIAS